MFVWGLVWSNLGLCSSFPLLTVLSGGLLFLNTWLVWGLRKFILLSVGPITTSSSKERSNASLKVWGLNRFMVFCISSLRPLMKFQTKKLSCLIPVSVNNLDLALSNSWMYSSTKPVWWVFLNYTIGLAAPLVLNLTNTFLLTQAKMGLGIQPDNN